MTSNKLHIQRCKHFHDTNNVTYSYGESDKSIILVTLFDWILTEILKSVCCRHSFDLTRILSLKSCICLRSHCVPLLGGIIPGLQVSVTDAMNPLRPGMLTSYLMDIKKSLKCTVVFLASSTEHIVATFNAPVPTPSNTSIFA